MNLNERAAKCMGLEKSGPLYENPKDRSEVFAADYFCREADIHYWNPGGTDTTPGDYNHARMLYERVVERGREWDVYDWLNDNRPNLHSPYDTFPAIMTLTAAQLTEACCEVLETSNEW